MNLVDKEDITLGQIRQKRRKVARLLDGRAGRDADVHAHLVGDDARKRRFAQPRRAIEQDVVERLASPLRRFDINRQIFLDLLLPVVFRKMLRPQRQLSCVRRDKGGRDDRRLLLL